MYIYLTCIANTLTYVCTCKRVVFCESETPYSYLIPNNAPIIVNIYQTNLHAAWHGVGVSMGMHVFVHGQQATALAKHI